MTDPIIDRPTGVFLSYAHADTARLQLFRDHFGPVERGKGFKVWFDRDIAGGQVWNEEIRKAIRDSDIFICLVTTNFLNSNYIRDTELPAIQTAVRNRPALLVPIIMEKCFWQDAFGVVQCVPTTKRGALRPAADWKPQRDGFHAAAEETAKAIERYLATMPPPPKNAGPGPSVIVTPDGFELADDGPSAAERVDPMQMATHAALKRRLDRLIGDMERSCRNSHPELWREVEDFRGFADVDLADLNLAALASIGTMLDGMARAYRPPLPAGAMAEPLEPHVIAGLDALLVDHARLMMGFAEGRELAARVAIQKTLIEDVEVTRTAAHGVLEPMVATHGLLATKARRLVEAIDRGLLQAGAFSSEVIADAVRSGGRLLAGINRIVGRRIDSRTKGGYFSVLDKNFVDDQNLSTIQSAVDFFIRHSKNIADFAVAQPELRRLFDWTLESLQRKNVPEFGSDTEVPKLKLEMVSLEELEGIYQNDGPIDQELLNSVQFLSLDIRANDKFKIIPRLNSVERVQFKDVGFDPDKFAKSLRDAKISKEVRASIASNLIHEQVDMYKLNKSIEMNVRLRRAMQNTGVSHFDDAVEILSRLRGINELNFSSVSRVDIDDFTTFRAVKSIKFTNCKINAADDLRKFTTLREINIRNCYIDNSKSFVVPINVKNVFVSDSKIKSFYVSRDSKIISIALLSVEIGRISLQEAKRIKSIIIVNSKCSISADMINELNLDELVLLGPEIEGEVQLDRIPRWIMADGSVKYHGDGGTALFKHYAELARTSTPPSP